MMNHHLDVDCTSPGELLKKDVFGTRIGKLGAPAVQQLLVPKQARHQGNLNEKGFRKLAGVKRERNSDFCTATEALQMADAESGSPVLKEPPWRSLVQVLAQKSNAVKPVKVVVTRVLKKFKPKKGDKDKVLTILVEITDGTSVSKALMSEELVLHFIGLDRATFLDRWYHRKDTLAKAWDKLQSIMFALEGIFDVQSSRSTEYPLIMMEYRRPDKNDLKAILMCMS